MSGLVHLGVHGGVDDEDGRPDEHLRGGEEGGPGQEAAAAPLLGEGLRPGVGADGEARPDPQQPRPRHRLQVHHSQSALGCKADNEIYSLLKVPTCHETVFLAEEGMFD